jgi:flagellar FliL protein
MAKKPKKEEAPPEAPVGEDGAEAKPGGRRKLFIMAGAGVLTLTLVGGGAAWFFGLIGARARPPEQQQAQPAPPPPPRVAFMDMPDITVNLAGTQARPQFLRLKVALEIPDAAMATQITPMMPRILDTFQTFLREMRTVDLEGSAAVHRVREELTRRVNLVVQPARVDAVLFREFLVQ